jgi:hypothetical protein
VSAAETAPPFNKIRSVLVMRHRPGYGTTRQPARNSAAPVASINHEGASVFPLRRRRDENRYQGLRGKFICGRLAIDRDLCHPCSV